MGVGNFGAHFLLEGRGQKAEGRRCRRHPDKTKSSSGQKADVRIEAQKYYLASFAAIARNKYPRKSAKSASSVFYLEARSEKPEGRSAAEMQIRRSFR